MATDSETPEPESPSAASLRANRAAQPDLAPSKPLQIFLLFALMVSGAAYVAGEWSELRSPSTPQTQINSPGIGGGKSSYVSHLDAGIILARERKFDKAVLQFRMALRVRNSAEVHHHLGLVSLSQSRPDSAIADFREAVRLNPRYIDSYLAWGQALMKQDKPEEAARIYRDALKAVTNSAPAHYHLGLALLQQATEAESSLRDAQSDGRDADAAALAVGVARFRSDALHQFSQAQTSGLDTPEFWRTYGDLLAKEQKYAEAEPILEKAVDAKPSLAPAQFALAVALDHQAKYTNAIAHYEAALVAAPDDPVTLNNLALLYATCTNDALRSPKMACQLATRASDSAGNQNPQYLDTLARCQGAAGDFTEALKTESQAIRRAEQLNDQALLRELRPRYAALVQHRLE